MDTVSPNQRALAWNVHFCDKHGVTFAGLYQDPDKPVILFPDAFQKLSGTIPGQVSCEDWTIPTLVSPAQLKLELASAVHICTG